MKSFVVAALVVTLGALAAPASASAGAPVASAAARCAIGDSGISYNRSGDRAVFRNLRAMRGMNCESARYVLNRWLRRTFEQSSRAKLPLSFYDGYVTWYCGKLTRRKWRCDEYDSNTAFRFVAYLT